MTPAEQPVNLAAAQAVGVYARRLGTRGMPRAERERQILEVAGMAFARGDYHSASMDEIAELAGVSKPMLYAYFGSKEGLYVAYIGRVGRELLERLIAAGEPGLATSPRAAERQLHARIEEFFAFVDEYRDGWRVLFREAASGALAAEVASLREQIAEGVRQLLEEALSSGRQQSPAAVEAVAHAIVGAGESMANWWLAHPGTPRAQVANWYVGVVQAAVRSLARRGWSAGDLART